MDLFIIIDWQDEERITVVKDNDGNTLRFSNIQDATQALVEVSNLLGHSFLVIKEI